jgi:hypothetical protein
MRQKSSPPETPSERIRSLLREPEFSGLIEKSATATFDTIAEGKKHNRIYPAFSEGDIQLAVQGLEARGWSEEMREALADPSKLGALPTEVTCRIQREWLETLASLPDPARTSWYREILGPLLRS